MHIDILVCTPGIESKTFQTFFSSLKKNTKDVDYNLTIFDNRYSKNFHHPTEINKFLNISTDYSVLCDDDVQFIDSDWLSYSINVLEKNNDIDVVGFHISRDPNAIRELPKSKELVNVFYHISCCLVLRKTNLRMNTSFLKHAFDLDFCFRVWGEHKKRVVLVPRRIIHNDGSRQSLRNDEETFIYKKARRVDKNLLLELWPEDKRKSLIQEIVKKYPDLYFKTGINKHIVV